MSLVSIGEAAQMVGLNPSALRYYEERGLIRPVARVRGRRMYNRVQLRRLVLVNMMQKLGVNLDAAAAILDKPSEQWRAHLKEHVAELEDLIARAKVAKDFLAHAIECKAEHPAEQCPQAIALLDRRLAGVTVEQIAAEHGHSLPAPSRRVN